MVEGHGVPDDVADAAWHAGRAFFALPLERRLEVAMPAAGYPYGYCPLSVGDARQFAGGDVAS